MIVVSDTSPINYLVLIRAIELLPKLYREVVIPPTVHRELQHPSTPAAVSDWLDAKPAWLRIESAGQIAPGLQRLDLGEAEAITLAKKLRADHLLIDERAGTKIAALEGLRPLSLLAVLAQAAEAQLIDLSEKLEQLQNETNYRMTRALAERLIANDIARKQRVGQNSQTGQNPGP